MLLGSNKSKIRWWHSPQNIVIALMAVVIVLMAAVIFPYRGWLSAQIIPDTKKLVFHDKKIIGQTIKYLPASTQVDVEKIYLHVDYKELQKLAYMRQQALENPAEKDFKYVAAKLEREGDMYSAKIRLKGDRSVHFDHENRWSFRVKMKGSNTLHGMKYFSFHKPVTRNYLYEWMLHKALQREDILSLQYKFVNLSMNGTDLGIYAIEEHFDKRLIERQKRREGPVIRFIENYHETTGLGSAPIGSFHVNDEMEEGAKKQLRSAVDLLDSFRRGDLPAEDVFDTERLAMFFAVSDLLGTSHGTISKSMRFYYNPITAKLEPIGYDGHYFDVSKNEPFISAEAAVDPRIGWTYNVYSTWFELLFNNSNRFNKKFVLAYMEALEEVSSPDYLEAMLTELKADMENNLAILHKDFPLKRDNIFEVGPDMFVFDTQHIYDRQAYIRNVLSEEPKIQAYVQQSLGNVTLSLANTFRLPVEIVSLDVDGEVLRPLQDDDVLVGKRVSPEARDIPAFKLMPFELAGELSDESTNKLTVTYRIIGSKKTYQTEPLPFPYQYTKSQGTEIMRRPANHQSFAFVDVDEKSKTIRLAKGRHDILTDLVFPEGYTVLAGPGVSLDLRNSAMILSKSPFQFMGSEESPITIESSDGTGQGLCLLMPPSGNAVTIFDRVIFNNLRASVIGDWSVSGSVTIHEATVDISNCKFIGNHSEDCLNLVRSKFKISNTSFINTLSDALDLDFSDGSIVHSEFIDSGNDAIDLSGSIVSVSDVVIKGVGDKAISVGERSSATASNITVSGAEIAITCKDDSYLSLDNCAVNDSRIGVTIYQKKPEFGPAKIEVTNLKLKGAEVPYMIEKRSILILEGEPFDSNYKKVKDILYGAEFGKSSK
jgi:hypothetical protein